MQNLVSHNRLLCLNSTVVLPDKITKILYLIKSVKARTNEYKTKNDTCSCAHSITLEFQILYLFTRLEKVETRTSEETRAGFDGGVQN